MQVPKLDPQHKGMDFDVGDKTYTIFPTQLAAAQRRSSGTSPLVDRRLQDMMRRDYVELNIRLGNSQYSLRAFGCQKLQRYKILSAL